MDLLHEYYKIYYINKLKIYKIICLINMYSFFGIYFMTQVTVETLTASEQLSLMNNIIYPSTARQASDISIRLSLYGILERRFTVPYRPSIDSSNQSKSLEDIKCIQGYTFDKKNLIAFPPFSTSNDDNVCVLELNTKLSFYFRF